MIVNADRKKNRGFALVLAGIATGVIAQTVLFFSWTGSLGISFPLPGLGIYALAGFLLILGMRRLGDSLPAFEVNTNSIPRQKPRFGFWILGLGLALAIATHASYASDYDRDGYLFAGMWIVSIAIIIFGVLQEEGWQPPAIRILKDWFKVTAQALRNRTRILRIKLIFAGKPKRIRANPSNQRYPRSILDSRSKELEQLGFKAHRAELFVITAIVIAAFFIRLWDVELHPYSFINDEGQVGSGGECILQGKCMNFFSLGWAAQPEPAFLPYAISILLFGRTAFAVRLVSVIVGTLSVLAVYLLAREVFDKKIAWLSALLLATLPVHVHFSRTGVDNIVDSLTAPLVLWLLFRGVKRGSKLSFLAAGIVAGFCIYTYPGSLLAPAFGVGALGLLALQTRGFLRAHYRNIIIFILAATVVVTPILGYYATHSTFFLTRLNKEGILQNGGLQHQMQTTGQRADEILLKQFWAASLVFIVTDAPLNFFNSPQAYLPPVEALIFMFGLAYLLWRIKDARCMVILVWFWVVVLLGGALTGSPPTSQRILMSMPALVIIIAIGMTKILEAFAHFRQSFVKFAPGILLGFVLLIGYTNISFYFYDYRIGHYYEDVKNELTYETRIYTAPLDTTGRMFLIADPKIPYLVYKSFTYFAPDMEKTTLNNVTREKLLNLPYDKDVLFIALPDYKSDLELIAQLIPGGEWHETRRRYQPEYMLFYSYKITKEQLAVFTSFARGHDALRP
jgi:hypothetical protein